MTSNGAPVVFRIKRKRNEDPLQALLVEDQRLKRSKSSQFIFKLARTDDSLAKNDSTAVLEREVSLDPSKRVFNIPKSSGTPPTAQSSNEPNAVSSELLDMVNDYLKLHDEKPTVKPPKRRQSQVSNEKPVILKDSVESDDYVYDVYYRDKAVQESWEKNKIGYIRFDEEDADFYLEDEEDDKLYAATDDEDSNAESFYRNDYPEDEDGGYEDDEFGISGDSLSESASDDEDDMYEIGHDRSRFTKKDFLETEGVDEKLESESDALDRLYAAIGNKKSLLPDDEDEDEEGGADDDDYDEDAMMSDEDEDHEVERNNFFPNEEDDELALHRDRIFGKLQRQINQS